jgi:two-component system, OmpR family, KDP operon response regulator KdpE
MMNSNPLVMAVDDEPSILQFIRHELATQDFSVVTVTSGQEALSTLEEQRPDVVLLDVMMPDMNGIEVLRRIRESSNVPVILLTARKGNEEKVRGLDMGADDYLAKPFNPEELSARVRAVLRRSQSAVGEDSEIVRSGAVEIDLHRRVVKKHGEVVSLTRTEWQLLHYLAKNAGRVILNAELLTRVWGPEYSRDLQYLRVWVSRLRSKLGDKTSNHDIITTMAGVGYLLNADDDSDASGESEVLAAVNS